MENLIFVSAILPIFASGMAGEGAEIQARNQLQCFSLGSDYR